MSIKSRIKYFIKGKAFLYDHSLCPKEEADGHDHIHVCFAARILGKDIKNHCPYYSQKGFEMEYGLDEEHGGTTCECDECRYFGTVRSMRDGLRFEIDARVVDLIHKDG